MKKNITVILITVIVLAIFVFILNTPVVTRQGIDYRVSHIQIPLYLKALNFIDRHYNYADLVKKITKDKKGPEEKAMALFAWTYQNIKRQPVELSIVDDHPWNIIVRGYGVAEQSSDVFTTLCNYAGMRAYYSYVYNKDRSAGIPLSFVKIKKDWYIFDLYNGFSFRDGSGRLLSIDKLKSGIDYLRLGNKGYTDIDYSFYLADLSTHPLVRLGRANIQSPFNRFIYQVRRWIEHR
ncbi:MAG: transglutaminase-like domain-containing protein [Candidatus Omnitrophota bacterium]